VAADEPVEGEDEEVENQDGPVSDGHKEVVGVDVFVPSAEKETLALHDPRTRYVIQALLCVSLYDAITTLCLAL